MSVQRRPPTGPARTGHRVQWIVRYRDPDGRSRSVSFPTQREAKLRDAEIRREIAQGAWIDPRDQTITVKELGEQWRDQAVREGTRRDRQFLVDNLGALTNCPLVKVRRTMVTEWANQLREGRPWADGRPLAESNVINRCGQLRSLFQHAIDDGLLARNPAVVLKRQPRPEGSVTERAVPTPEMIRSLITTAVTGGTAPGQGQEAPVTLPASPWLSMAVRIASETGLRAGEVAGLVWGDIDLADRTLRVRRQRGQRSGERVALKTRTSLRDIPISAPLTDYLGDLRDGGEGDPVVRSVRGRPVTTQRISASMPKLRCIAGVPEEISFHGLRHYYASRLLASGVPLPTVSALLGHGNIAVTAQVYAHYLPGQMELARDALERLAGEIG